MSYDYNQICLLKAVDLTKREYPMEQYQQIIQLVALTMGVAWASGINLYATLLMLGISGATGYMQLPENLSILQDPVVIAAAGIMYAVEFFADKTPGVDSAWDTLHTFIRIPAGAVLAAGMAGEASAALTLAAAIIGGGLATTSHATKAGGRLLINTSPEPVSNWTASFSEDILVIAGLWAAMNHPVAFLILLVIFILLTIWLLPKLWRGIKKIIITIGGWFGYKSKKDPTPNTVQQDMDRLEQIEKLKALFDKGAISQEEYDFEKKRILS